MTTHTGKYKYNWSYCENSYLRNQELNRHMKVHTTEKTFQCTQCNKYFSNKYTLAKHMMKHDGKDFKCSYCEKSFLRNGELLRHMTVHKDEGIYQCSKCDMSYITNSDLISHMAMHIDKESFTCTVCEKSFLSNDEFSNHMVIHTGNFMVNITDNREIPFSKQNDLRNHISPPTSEKPYKCEKCEKSFSEESTLLSHQLTTHNYRIHNCSGCENASIQMSLCNCNDKPHQCKRCEKIFAQMNVCYNSENDVKQDDNVLNSDFKGNKFINPKGYNLCHLNSTVTVVRGVKGQFLKFPLNITLAIIYYFSSMAYFYVHILPLKNSHT